MGKGDSGEKHGSLNDSLQGNALEASLIVTF